MNPTVEISLQKIRETLVMMAGLTDRNLSLALRGLIERNETLVDLAETEDSQLDTLEVQLDEMIVTHIATAAPIATDCRFMMVASKISSNLERIGDQCVNIARRSRDLNQEPLLKPLVDIPRMGQMTQEMLRDGMKAFMESLPSLAQEVIDRDPTVDNLNRQIQRELTTFMLENPGTITRALNLMLVARSLERIADHAKNISEEVYYLHSAQDIRHTHKG
jgi:phosphate transport system protein